MSEYDDDLDQDIDNIITQLKNQGKALRNAEQKIVKDKPSLAKEDIEKFIIDNASGVVSDCVEMIGDIKESMTLTDEGNPRLIESASELIKAFTSAIDTLSKLKLSDDKIKAQKEIKQMDIASKLELDTNKDGGNKDGIFLSREEVIKGLLSYKDTPPDDTKPDTPAIEV